MTAREEFEIEKKQNICAQGDDVGLRDLALTFMRETGRYKYTYNFSWMGFPVIQFPQDLIAVSEIIFRTQPDLIIETGVAHGGGLIFYASLLEMIDNAGIVVGVEVDLREHNRRAILDHSLARRIRLIDGSSTSPEVIAAVNDLAAAATSTLVVLDSNHTHEHVLRELELYAPLVRVGGYLVVFDTTIEDQPEGFFTGKPWDKHNNPKTAVREYLRRTDRFVVDPEIENKLLITVAREGYLRCVKPAS
jgi:cephalosporin hydroxylase